MGILFAILSFVGFEATAVFRDEAKDPDRTIPRATYISLISIGVFYTVSSWVLISANGESGIVANATENPGTILQSTTQAYLGAAGGHIVQLLFVTSLFACILSFHNIASRYLFQLGARGVLAARLGNAHPVLGAPSAASVVASAAVALLIAAAAVALGPDRPVLHVAWRDFLGGHRPAADADLHCRAGLLRAARNAAAHCGPAALPPHWGLQDCWPSSASSC